MGILEMILMGGALSMDAAAVAMSNGMCYANMSKGKAVAQPLLFGGFQGIMPLAGGLLAGTALAGYAAKYGGIVVFAILGIIGFKMAKEGFDKRNVNSCYLCHSELTYRILAGQALATSIDAFAVGVGLGLMDLDLPMAAGIIGVTTAIVVTAAVFVGKAFGSKWGYRAEIAGGLVLIFLGAKALLLRG